MRAMAPSRESRYADWTSSAETGCRAASAPRRFAPAVRVGLPANRSLSNDFNGLGRTPNVCKRMSSRLQKLSTVPLHELDAIMCTDPGGQQAPTWCGVNVRAPSSGLRTVIRPYPSEPTAPIHT